MSDNKPNVKIIMLGSRSCILTSKHVIPVDTILRIAFNNKTSCEPEARIYFTPEPSCIILEREEACLLKTILNQLN